MKNPDVPAVLLQEDFCCEQLVSALREGKLALSYDDSIRDLQIFNKGYQWVQRIDYCPFCGAKRPPSLYDAWEKEMEALGDEKVWHDDTLVPEELKTDAWWKKGKA